MKGICKQCGRISHNIVKGLCKKHYEQLVEYGKFLDNNPRTRYDPNEYIIKEDYVEVFTYDNHNNVDYIFKVDIEDLPYIIKYKWNHTRPKFTQDGNVLVYMTNDKIGLFHRIVMGNPNNYVDHINRNTLDNRKSNLRIVSMVEQNLNRSYKSERFDVKGVDIHKDVNRKKRYAARLNLNKKTYRSPWYYTFEEAAYARYLLEQLSPIEIYNPNISKYVDKIAEDKRNVILKWFVNRFKDRV